MTNKSFAQAMPPEGGFGEIKYKATPAKRWISNYKLLGAGLIFTIYTSWYDRKIRKTQYYERVEDDNTSVALEPFLEAERDRSFLLQLWKNREMENMIMKDVPGWQTGTFFGVPHYKTLEEDTLIPERMVSFNMFSRDRWSREAEAERQGLNKFFLN